MGECCATAGWGPESILTVFGAIVGRGAGGLVGWLSQVAV